MERKRVGILVFPDVEVLDFCGPFEVFSVTRLDEARRREDPSPFEPVLVAETTAVVSATGGLRVIPQWRCAWWRATMARPSPAPPRGTWSTPIPRATSDASNPSRRRPRCRNRFPRR